MAFVSDKEAGVSVAIVGATGAVGKELAQLLVSSNFPLKEFVLFTSRRSANDFVELGDRRIRLFELPTDLLDDPLMDDIELVFFADCSDLKYSI